MSSSFHYSSQKGTTIAAIATPPGEGAIAIIRISGPEARHVAQKIFTKNISSLKTHTACLGRIVDREGATIDVVLILFFQNPTSYTGEDVVEIHCHGGAIVSRQVLKRVFEAGARPAMPGEFTFQAFCNGKVDLAQAEAVQQLIASKSEQAICSASKQLEGALSRKISCFQKELTSIAAVLEAWVDFPEEGLEFISMGELTAQLEKVCHNMKALFDTFREGKALSEKISLCLVGAPNVGKSSLMNALLGKDRAIVTDIPGTTRDVLEDELFLCGLSFRILDTAGIRKTTDIVEREGILRSKAAFEQADLILLLLDASRPLFSEDRELLESVPREKTIVIWNKVDIALPPLSLSCEPLVLLSAQEQTGLDTLRTAIEQMVWKNGPPSKEEVLITSFRHSEALNQAIQACHLVIDGLKNNVSAEFLAFDMRTALYELGSIIGTNVGEDILSSIFSQFCLGK